MVPNLMIGFGIDEIQADYVAEIKLRHLNREYILKRTEEISKLERDIAEMEAILKSAARIRGIIIGELQEIGKKYGQPRRSRLIYASEIEEAAAEAEEEIPDYPCTLFFTAEGYFKKITPAIPADERRAQAQRGRPDCADGGGGQQPRSALLHRQGHGLQGQGRRISRTPRPASWGIM